MKITKVATVNMPMVIDGPVVPKASGAARTSIDTLRCAPTLAKALPAGARDSDTAVIEKLRVL